MVNTLELRGIDSNLCTRDRAGAQCRGRSRHSGTVRAYFLSSTPCHSTRYTYDSHYHTWRQNPDIEAFELNYLEIQPIVVPAYKNIGWDEQGEVIPGISMTVVRRIPTRNLTCGLAIQNHVGV